MSKFKGSIHPPTYNKSESSPETIAALKYFQTHFFLSTRNQRNYDYWSQMNANETSFGLFGRRFVFTFSPGRQNNRSRALL